MLHWLRYSIFFARHLFPSFGGGRHQMAIGTLRASTENWAITASSDCTISLALRRLPSGLFLPTRVETTKRKSRKMGLSAAVTSNASAFGSTNWPYLGANDCEQTGECYEYTPYVNRPETYIVPFLFAIIFIVGVLGNGTLIVIFMRHPTMRNIPNT